MVNKLSMIINGRTQNNEEIKQTISNLNTELFESTDSTVVDTFKVNCKNFAIALNGLTTNQLLSIELQSVEDITGVNE